MNVMRIAKSTRQWLLWTIACGVLLVATTAVHAENCPWLNAATAEGVLGVPVTMLVTHPNATAVSCDFSRSGTGASLRIDVTTPEDAAAAFAKAAAKCGTEKRKLIGVGNEAVGCTLPESSSTVEHVVGRVRGRIFVLHWTRMSNTPQSSEAPVDTIQGVAEAVAGSMF